MAEYLIICKTKGMATSLLYRMVDYIVACYVDPDIKVNKREGVIVATGLNARIRFVTEAKEDEARRGFTGIIVSGYALDKFLDPWEVARCREALKKEGTDDRALIRYEEAVK